jgi:hypothetical protein
MNTFWLTFDGYGWRLWTSRPTWGGSAFLGQFGMLTLLSDPGLLLPGANGDAILEVELTAKGPVTA